MRGKSRQALCWCVERVVESGVAVAWTWTLPVAMSHGSGSSFFSSLLRRVRAVSPFAWGVRVAEVGGGGLHWHLVVAGALPLLEYGLPMSITHERPADLGAVAYLAKYLSKGGVVGGRAWGSFGPWRKTRVADVVLDSAYTRNRELLVSGCRLDYRSECWLYGASLTWGDAASWPEIVRKRCAEALGAERMDLVLRSRFLEGLGLTRRAAIAAPLFNFHN